MSAACCCVYCRQEKSSKGIYCHVDRAHMNATQYSSGHNGKYDVISARAQNRRTLAIKQYENNPRTCVICAKTLTYEQRKGKFCSRSCATKHTNKVRKESGWTPSTEQRRKASEKLSGRVYVSPINVVAICKTCQKEFMFIHHYTKRKKEFCSRSCACKHRNNIRNKDVRAKRPALTNYRADCAFKFNLKDFPDEFNFTLIEKYGWYKAKNKGNNLGGVSRDHMVSVRYGFDNKIDPSILSHPVNCRLLNHNENSSKGKNNYITLENLKIRIERWNKKYNIV